MRKTTKFCGLRVSALIEIAIMIGLLLVVDQFWGQADRFQSSSLHPFWVIVLLMSVQYGTFEGVAAVIACTLVLYMGQLPPQSVNESIFSYRIRITYTPFLWFVFAFVLGEMRRSLQRQKDRIEEKYIEAADQANVIANTFQDLEEEKKYLENLLITQEQTSASIYRMFEKLEMLNPGRLFVDVQEIIKIAFDPPKFSIFVHGSNGFEAVVNEGWEESDSYLRRIDRDHPLYKRVMEKEGVLCVINQEDEQVLKNEGVLASVLKESDTGEVIGLIKIEEMDFSLLHSSNITVFQVIADLIGRVYSNAKKYHAMEQNALYLKTDSIYSNPFYQALTHFLNLQEIPFSEMEITPMNDYLAKVVDPSWGCLCGEKKCLLVSKEIDGEQLQKRALKIIEKWPENEGKLSIKIRVIAEGQKKEIAVC